MLPTNPRFRINSTVGLYFKLLSNLIPEGRDQGTLNILEQKLSEKFNKEYCIFVPQARVGIYLAIKSLIRNNKKEIVLSPYTIADVVNMVICAGAIPVFADISRNSCNITPESVRKRLTPNTAAVMITHLHGIPADPVDFQNLCDSKGLPLVEDAAQAFGAKLCNKAVGSFGKIGIFSFGRYKNITSFYGGAVLTDDKEITESIRKEISSYSPMPKRKLLKRGLDCLIKDLLTAPGIYHFFTYQLVKAAKRKKLNIILKHIEAELDLSLKNEFPDSYKDFPLSVQAEMVLSKLDSVDSDTKVRISNAKIYHQHLSHLHNLITPSLATDGSSIYTCYPVQYEFRDELVTRLLDFGCDIGVQHIKNCADLPAFQAFYRDCPNARATANETIMLPTYPAFGGKNIERTAQAVRKIIRS